MKFKHNIMFRVQVTVNGKQEYAINTTDYDKLCDELTTIYIQESK